MYQRALPHQRRAELGRATRFSSLVAASRPWGSERKSPVYQRALPHQGEPSLAGHARFSSLVAASRPWGSYQQSRAYRHADQGLRRSQATVRGAVMRCEVVSWRGYGAPDPSSRPRACPQVRPPMQSRPAGTTTRGSPRRNADAVSNVCTRNDPRFSRPPPLGAALIPPNSQHWSQHRLAAPRGGDAHPASSK
jgi:hypothetical protein